MNEILDIKISSIIQYVNNITDMHVIYYVYYLLAIGFI